SICTEYPKSSISIWWRFKMVCVRFVALSRLDQDVLCGMWTTTTKPAKCVAFYALAVMGNLAFGKARRGKVPCKTTWMHRRIVESWPGLSRFYSRAAYFYNGRTPDSNAKPTTLSEIGRA